VEAGGELERRERAAAVRRAVAGLSARYREVVVLHYLEGMEIGEVGRTLGVSANAVAVRLHRARGMLRETLGKWMGEGD